MPAHCSEKQAVAVKKGDGSPLTVQDVQGNAEADRLAKKGVEEHRIESAYLQRWGRLKEKARQTAMWTAKATELANNVTEFPFRDSTASRTKAMAEARAKTKANRAKDKETKCKRREIIIPRPRELGGHELEPTTNGPRSGWRCTVCKASSASWANIAQGKCQGSVARRWAQQVATLADNGMVVGCGHVQVLSGSVVWCWECGAYGDAKAIGLPRSCKAPFPPQPDQQLGEYGAQHLCEMERAASNPNQKLPPLLNPCLFSKPTLRETNSNSLRQGPHPRATPNKSMTPLPA